jgi:ADP-heptose:LPS heptosyltransferase
MGDLLMSVPAVKALKETFQSKITLLTSAAASSIAPYIKAIDDVIIYDVPWMKDRNTDQQELWRIISLLRERQFDGAVIFTVFSQNPLPSTMIAYLAEIPLRLAYSRENPYQLLTHWVPDAEPYHIMRHQVRRDLDLVKYVGAKSQRDDITIELPIHFRESSLKKLVSAGVDVARPWLIMHPGVSETKRKYPTTLWIETARKLIRELSFQIVLTGVESERALTENIRMGSGGEIISLTGTLNIEEFIMLIQMAPLVISVNTSTAHIAAATGTKIVVLYAMTNPQHTPWKATGSVLPFSVPENLRSKNEVLRFVQEKYFPSRAGIPSPDDVVTAVRQLLSASDINANRIPELVDFISSTKNRPEYAE